MKALILAAGYATRLYPLTRAYPKPLLEVRGRPIIDYVIDKISRVKDIDEIVVVTNSKFIGIFRSWRSRHVLKKKISLVDDLTKDNASRMGAVADIDFAVRIKKINAPLLVIGGDNLFSAGLSDFIRFVKRHKESPVIGAFRIARKKDASRYGVIKVDENKRITDFKEKPAHPGSNLVAMCLYYFPKDILILMREYLKKSAKKTDATGAYVNWLTGKADVYAVEFGGIWYDIGDFKFYNTAKLEFLKRKGKK